MSVENQTGCDDTFSEYSLCTFDLLDLVVNFSWLLYELNVVFMQRGKYSICYTAATYELHIPKKCISALLATVNTKVFFSIMIFKNF